jgi:hypothetical protein
MVIIVYDYASDSLYRTTVGALTGIASRPPSQWDPGQPYVVGDIVSHAQATIQQIWVAEFDNINSEPLDGNPDWRLATASDLNMQTYNGAVDPVVINLLNHSEGIFKYSDVDGPRTWNFVNIVNLIKCTIFINLTGAGPWDQDFSILAGLISDNGTVAAGVWSPAQPGKYKLSFEWDGTEFFLSISNMAA